MSNQIYVNSLNEKISYVSGKIYWKPNKDWSSELWEQLYKQGYRMESHKSGLTDIFDNQGLRIVWGAIGRVNALYELAKAMR